MKENDNNHKELENVIHTLACELVDRDKRVSLLSNQGNMYLQILYNHQENEYNLVLTVPLSHQRKVLARFKPTSLHASRLYSLESALMKMAHHYDLNNATIVIK